jgi:xanthine dehydrogenase small subunit
MSPMVLYSVISFTLNGQLVRLPADIPATTTMLDWLRGPAGLCGTKEGCAEGDCGACTVALEQPDGGRAAVNACLLTLGQAHGRSVRTVEGLRDASGAAHEVQETLASCGGTQCGFCTPGIVMSVWAHQTEGGDVHEALAGNLCRCTGYRPILDAMAKLPAETRQPADAPAPLATQFVSPVQVFHRPVSLPKLLKLRSEHPEAMLLAGGTDLGLRFSEHREVPKTVICTLDVAELGVIEVLPEGMQIGASVPYRALLSLCETEAGYAPFARLLARLGSRQIRSMGTLGGNLGTASPIGDALPPLLAMGASVRLAGPEGEREMLVEDFLLGYRKTALEPGEVIRDLWLPRPSPDSFFACDKLSRRHDQDITAAGLAAMIAVKGGEIVSACIAHGGLGPKVARAVAAEAALEGAPFAQASFDTAAEALDSDIAPMDDLRASALYRRRAAANLLRRMWFRFALPELA